MDSFPFRSMFLLTLFLGFSCNPDTSDYPQVELSDFAREYLSLRTGVQSAMLEHQTGTINKSFQILYGTIQRMSDGPVAVDSTGYTEPGDPGSPGDTTVWEEPQDTTLYTDPWISCASMTEAVNPDNSVTTVVDYGEGCDEGWGDWKYRMWGKIISTYYYHNTIDGAVLKDVYYSDYEYDHYGGYYYYDSSDWEMNGISHYEGESTYDTAFLSFSGWYMYDDNNTYRWQNETYSYKGSGKTLYDNSKSVTEYADYEYSNGDDYYYHTSALEPLVMDYGCSSPAWMVRDALAEGEENSISYIFTYVSGVEEIFYHQDDKEGYFIIDYGDGECDNIITITENGKTSIVDLSDNWILAEK